MTSLKVWGDDGRRPEQFSDDYELFSPTQWVHPFWPVRGASQQGARQIGTWENSGAVYVILTRCQALLSPVRRALPPRYTCYHFGALPTSSRGQPGGITAHRVSVRGRRLPVTRAVGSRYLALSHSAGGARELLASCSSAPRKLNF